MALGDLHGALNDASFGRCALRDDEPVSMLTK